MAAAYETGTATDQNDLLQKLATWLAAQGWTANMNAADSPGWRLHMNKGAFYINIRGFTGAEAGSKTWQTTDATGYNGVALYLGTGYNGASAWRSQGGGPATSGSVPIGANVLINSGLITAYHFFDDGDDNIVVVIEKGAGVFGAMGWGPSIEKAGTWTGGQYFFGQMPGYYMNKPASFDTSSIGNGDAPFAQGCALTNNFSAQAATAWVRADVDTFTGKWISNATSKTTDSYRGATGWYGTTDVLGVTSTVDITVPSYNTFQANTLNPANGRGALLPINFYVTRAAGYMSLLGRIPNLFITRHTYSPAAVVSVGGVNYMAFPAVYGNTPSVTTDMSFMVRKLA